LGTARNALFDDAAPKVRIDLAAAGAQHRITERRVRDPLPSREASEPLGLEDPHGRRPSDLAGPKYSAERYMCKAVFLRCCATAPFQATGSPMTKPVVTRFAPSPTGFLHIGGARTALFNWAYARHTGGKFLLRIEDTDRERSTEAAVAAILDGLRWLELDWDGEPLFQFARAGRHREVAQEMLAAGNAYRCYLTPDELKVMHDAIAAERALAKQEKRAPRGPQTVQSPWRDRDPKEAPAGVAPALRLRAPREGETVVDDKVQGRVTVPNTQLDDMVILRSDGTPTYNFAVVVDDHDMGVTHVIRGVDHLTNAARQVQIHRAMGWDVPVFAHVPLIHGPDGAKLSKRHGALGVEAYRTMGFLPAGLRNYLARLGWSHGDDEIFSTEQMIAWFDIADINKSPARLDFAKMADVNAHYIRRAGEAELLGRIRAFLPEAEGGPGLAARFAAIGWDKLEAALPSLKARAKTLKDLVDGAAYLVEARPLALDEKAAKLMDADARTALARLLPQLEAAPDWQAAALEGIVRTFSEATGAKLGAVAQPLRAALTGKAVSPPVFDVMAALGREEALARIRDQAR
jgi:glutamyl-tRNA synthetase